MRTTFINTLTKLAQKDKRIYLLTGDLGFLVFENFAKKFPKRFVNCGVAEQNMMGVAAGLALSGKKPYVYSIIPFVTMRCFEQIRNDIAYQNLDVKIIGVGGGLSYGILGPTHHAIEDLAILRALPNFTVLCPGDPIEAEQLILKSYSNKSPTYIRLNRNGEKIIHNKKDKIEIGKPFVIKKGKDGAIIANGVFLEVGKEVVEKLEKNGYNVKLISFPTLKPIDRNSLIKELKDQNLIFSLEEHNVIGGLGGAVAEILTQSSWRGAIKKIGILDQFCPVVGKPEYLRKKYRLTTEQLTNYILRNIKSSNL